MQTISLDSPESPKNLLTVDEETGTQRSNFASGFQRSEAAGIKSFGSPLGGLECERCYSKGSTETICAILM